MAESLILGVLQPVGIGAPRRPRMSRKRKPGYESAEQRDEALVQSYRKYSRRTA